MNPRLFFQRHRALSVCFSRFPISLPYLLPVHRCRRTGVSSITFTINVQAAPLTQCSQSGSKTRCSGSFLPASSPGALVSSSAPSGWVINNATLAGAYVRAPQTTYNVPTATGYILGAQDDGFLKMVQVSSLTYIWPWVPVWTLSFVLTLIVMCVDLVRCEGGWYRSATLVYLISMGYWVAALALPT